MGIDISSLVSQAIKTASSLVNGATESITYKKQNADPIYDTTTGTENFYTNFTIDRVIRTKLSNSEINDTTSQPNSIYNALDKVYLVASKDLGFAPSLGDQIITLSDNKLFEIIGIVSIPTDSLYKIIVRSP